MASRVVGTRSDDTKALCTFGETTLHLDDRFGSQGDISDQGRISALPFESRHPGFM